MLNVHVFPSVIVEGAGGTVISERRGTVMVIGINRPEARNAVNQETAQRLTEELSAFDQDNSLNVAVLHGVGKFTYTLLLMWTLVYFDG